LRNGAAPLRVFHEQRKEVVMRKLTLAAVAAATLLAAAAPAMAQVGFYAGPGGFSIGVGAPYYGYPYGYYDYYGGPYVGPVWHHHWRWHHRR
jgi:hypothetical protein